MQAKATNKQNPDVIQFSLDYDEVKQLEAVSGLRYSS